MEFSQLLPLLIEGTIETLYMVVIATGISYALGIPIGILLYISDEKGLCENKKLNNTLGTIVNFLRAVPFIILLIAIMPFTKLVVGTNIGINAVIVPLVVSASPFVGRMVEASLQEVNAGVIEAAEAMGSSPFQIITKVLLPEAKPSLINGATITTTTILAYSAMAGFTGGGGLGSIAVNYGYYRYEDGIMFITVIFLVVIVQIFQEIGIRTIRRTDKRIRNN
ncbi:MAG: methionine ABC transporter permease [Eubacteriales bacterium]